MYGWQILNNLNDVFVALRMCVLALAMGKSVNVSNHRAGAIPFRLPKKKDASVSIMLITSMTRKRWILPKGVVEDGEAMTDTAERETVEETGVKGKLIAEYPMTVLIERQLETGLEQVPCTFYPLLAKSMSKRWQEDDLRERKWVPLREARRMVTDDDYSELLTQFETLLPAILKRV
ncbi:MAG: NUDIX hydrolase [Pseudomonadota bacterium]